MRSNWKEVYYTLLHRYSRWLYPMLASVGLLIAFMLIGQVPANSIISTDGLEAMGAASVPSTGAAAASPAPPGAASTSGGVDAARKAMVPNGQLISVWGDPRDGGKRRHEGEDLAAPHGSPIYAPLDLTIYKNERNRLGGWAVNGRDAFGRRWYFAHLNQQSHLEVNSAVKAGQIIGYVGNTGNAITTPPHLHYQVTWPNGDWGNPVDVLRNYPETEGIAPTSSPP